MARRIVAIAMLLVTGACTGSPGPARPASPPEERSHFLLELKGGAATRSGPHVVVTLTAEDPFPNAALQRADGEDYAVAIGVSTDRDPAFERLCYVHVRPDKSPYAVVTKDRGVPEADLSSFSPRRTVAGTGSVGRPTAESVAIEVRARLLGLPASGRFRWRARMVSSPRSGTLHYDYLPEVDRPLERSE